MDVVSSAQPTDASTRCIDLLLRLNADPTAADLCGATPLHWAQGFSTEAAASCARALLEAKADASAPDRAGRTTGALYSVGGLEELRAGDARRWDWVAPPSTPFSTPRQILGPGRQIDLMQTSQERAVSDLFVESFDLHDDVAQKEVERNRGKVLVAHDQGVILGAVSWQIVPLGARAAP